MRGRNRLEACDAEAHHEHLRGPECAAGRRDFRKNAVHLRRAKLHGIVSCECRLTRECVHGLRPRYTRDAFHGKAGDLPIQQLAHQPFLMVRVDEGH